MDIQQLEQKMPLRRRPWFQGAWAFFLSIPTGTIVAQIGRLILLSPAPSVEAFFLQISLLLIADIIILIPIVSIALFFALVGAIIASMVARKYHKNLFRSMFIIGTIITIILAVVFMKVFSDIKSAEYRDKYIKRNVCTSTNIYIRNYYEINKEYPMTFEQWAPDRVLKESPLYNSLYIRTSSNSFTYTVTLNGGKKFTVTEKDLFSTFNPTVSEQCEEWLRSL